MLRGHESLRAEDSTVIGAKMAARSVLDTVVACGWSFAKKYL